MASSKTSDRENREARERYRKFTARQTVHATQVRRRKRDNGVALAILGLAAGIAIAAQVVYFTTGPGAPEPLATAQPTAEPTAAVPTGTNVGDIPDPQVAENRSWTGSITLNDIELQIQLDGAAAPQAVASFVTDSLTYLTDKPCHRLVLTESAHLLQCGAEDAEGTADPNYRFGPIENAPMGDVYPAGSIAMARIAGDAYSQGHQFFIVLSDTVLPADSAGGYSIIGQVTGGLDALDAALTAGGIASGGSSPEDGPPAESWTITGISVQ